MSKLFTNYLGFQYYLRFRLWRYETRTLRCAAASGYTGRYTQGLGCQPKECCSTGALLFAARGPPNAATCARARVCTIKRADAAVPCMVTALV
eukprot:124204-Chlamydomonas_euryale.AAC.4